MKTRIFTTVMMVFFTVSMLCGTTSAKGKGLKIISNLEIAIDPAIKIENWMLNDLDWNKTLKFNLTTASEDFLEIEPWMTQPLMWEKIEVAQEEELTLENWMVDENVWDTNSFDLEIEKDSQLKVENWMTDIANWK
jgi:hypothetical protein